MIGVKVLLLIFITLMEPVVQAAPAEPRDKKGKTSTNTKIRELSDEAIICTKDAKKTKLHYTALCKCGDATYTFPNKLVDRISDSDPEKMLKDIKNAISPLITLVGKILTQEKDKTVKTDIEVLKKHLGELHDGTINALGTLTGNNYTPKKPKSKSLKDVDDQFSKYFRDKGWRHSYITERNAYIFKQINTQCYDITYAINVYINHK